MKTAVGVDFFARVADWLARYSEDNLGTEISLRSIKSDGDWQVTVARAADEFRGASVVNASGCWWLEAVDNPTLEILISLVRATRAPSQLTISGRITQQARPLLTEAFTITHEHELTAMSSHAVVSTGPARWAEPGDIAELERLQLRYNQERRTVCHPAWAELVRSRRVSIATEGGVVRSMVSLSPPSARFETLAGAFTDPEHRRRSFAAAATGFAVRSCLEVGRPVHLVVDSGNVAASNLYERLGFVRTGSIYTAYLS